MSIRKKQQFYNYAVGLGIDLKDLNVDNLDFTQPIKHKSSFKKRASEIKEMFNHKFDFGFRDYPNIETIKFERL